MDQLTPPTIQKKTAMPIILMIASVLVVILTIGAYFLFFRDKTPAEQYIPESSEAIKLPELEVVSKPSQLSTTSPQIAGTTTIANGGITSPLPTSIGSETSATGSQTAPQAVGTTTPPALRADRPTLTVGEKWTWTNRTEAYKGTEGGLLAFTLSTKTGGTSTRYRTNDLNLVKDVSGTGVISTVRSPHTGMLAFPLTIGKRWTHQYDSDGIPRTATYSVTDHASILTASGKVNAFKITGVDKRNDRPYGVAVTVWYAPEKHAIVLSSGTDQSNNTPVSGWNYELTGHKK